MPLDDPRIIGWPALCADHAQEVTAEQVRELGKSREEARAESLELVARLLVLGSPDEELAKVHPDPGSLRLKAVQGLIRQSLGGRPACLENPRAQRALCVVANDSGQSPAVHLEAVVLPAGMLLATSYFSEPRRIRLGRKWLKNEAGKVVGIRPDALDLTSCAQWLVQEAFNGAETQVLGARPQRTVPLNEDVDGCDLGDGPDDLVAFWEQIVLLDKTATPAERQLLALLAEHEDADDLPALLGKAPSTIRVLRSNLRKKAPELASVLGVTASGRRAARSKLQKKAAAI
jgi:hypothetical protein